MNPPGPHQAALRRGRVSVPEATYFLTICAQRPCDNFVHREVFDAMRDRLVALATAEIWSSAVLQLMPDHVHLFGRLGHALSLGDFVRTFKGPLSPVLRNRGVRWQAGGYYYDHRLRREEERGPILRYMLTNPYRKGLVGWDQIWPNWYCAAEVWEWFAPTTNNGRPFPEWMSERSPGNP